MHLRVVCLADWHLEVFYYPYYKIKNAGVYELNFIHPNIYYRTTNKIFTLYSFLYVVWMYPYYFCINKHESIIIWRFS